VKGTKHGNIYTVARKLPIADPELKAFFDELCERTTSFPFCGRWFDHPKASANLNKLMRHGLITGYAQLVEAKKGCVTQSEHTVYVSSKKAEITTLP
jgi:methionyl aminopeptidase